MCQVSLRYKMLVDYSLGEPDCVNIFSLQSGYNWCLELPVISIEQKYLQFRTPIILNI